MSGSQPVTPELGSPLQKINLYMNTCELPYSLLCRNKPAGMYIDDAYLYEFSLRPQARGACPCSPPERAGYQVLPKGNAKVPFVILETLLPLLALVAISIMQLPIQHAAAFYCAVGLLGTGFIYFGWEFVFERSSVAARRLLTASIVYLPLLYGLSATFCNRAK